MTFTYADEAYLAAGQGSAAAAEFQRILDHSGIVWNCWTGALAHLGVARANALQARASQGADADAARVRALAAYKDFLTLWKDADPDIPVLKEAKGGVREAAVKPCGTSIAAITPRQRRANYGVDSIPTGSTNLILRKQPTATQSTRELPLNTTALCASKISFLAVGDQQD